MSSPQEVLSVCESLLTTLFNPTTPNDQRKQINSQLDAIVQNSKCDHALYFLSVTTERENPHVVMFALNTLQEVISREWWSLSTERRLHIRHTICQMIHTQYTAASSGFVVNKLIKLDVDIAKQEWPETYTDFFSNIVALVGNPDSVELGLQKLLIASEEIGVPKASGVTTNQRIDQLYKQLIAEIPKVLPILSQIMESCIASIHVIATQNHDSREPKALERQWSLCNLTLSVLGHIVSWVPLVTLSYTPDIINKLFLHAKLELALLCEGCPPMPYLGDGTSLKIFKEIVVKRRVPSEFEAGMVEVINRSLDILELLLDKIGPEKAGKQNEALNMYSTALAELALEYIEVQFERFLDKHQFPTARFVELFSTYTFRQTDPETFYICLRVWNQCIDLFGTKTTGKPGNAARGVQLELPVKVYELLLLLVQNVMKQLQHATKTIPFDLDIEDVDEAGNTEWQIFINACIELVMKLAEYMPEQVLTSLAEQWNRSVQSYTSLHTHIHGDHFVIGGNHMDLVWYLKDFSVLLQCLGRIYVFYIGPHFISRFSNGENLLKKVVSVATYNAKHKFYALNMPHPMAKAAFEVTQAQALATLKEWCPWLAELHQLSLKDDSYTHQCSQMTSDVMAAVAPIVKDTTQHGASGTSLLLTAACHLMVSLTGSVRPPSIWKLKEFTELYSGVPHIKMPREDYRLLVRALSNVLVLQWPGIPEQRWDERQKHLTKFLKDLTQEFRELKNMPYFMENAEVRVRAREPIIRTLDLIGDLVESVAEEISQSKKLCHDCISEYIDQALWLLPMYVSSSNADPDVGGAIFAFFLKMLDVLKPQLGVTVVEQALRTLFQAFDKGRWLDAAFVQSQDESRGKAAEKFLAILELVIKDNSPAFRVFIPSILDLCLNQIQPLIVKMPGADLRLPYYSLLYNVLLYQWRYFFKTRVHERKFIDEAHNVTEFMAIMEAMGHSFTQPDLTAFGHNLKVLIELNSRWGLFKKPVFSDSLLYKFLNVLLQVLFQQSHDLLREDLHRCIYEMAIVDYDKFLLHFLPNFFAQIEKITEEHKATLVHIFKDQADAPSFTMALDKFADNLRYYQTTGFTRVL